MVKLIVSAALNPAQEMVGEYGVLDSGFSCVLQLATGAGKTWLAREAIRKSIGRGHRCVYLSPLKALADELAREWGEELAPHKVGVFTGDYGRPGKSLPVPYRDARVLIMTPERLDACTRSWRSHWSWIPEIDWIVADEIHLLGDGHRGARVEGTLSRIQRLNPLARCLALSATLGNRGELADWLGGVELVSDWRPVPLQWRLARYRKAEEKPDIMRAELDRSLKSGGQSIVFVQSRRRAEQLAGLLIGDGVAAAHHHAGLNHDQRRSVETRFRDRQLNVLVATGTLEMGLNLPARQVILYDVQGFDGVGFSPLSTNTIWQRAGRAGRRGLDSEAEAVLIVPRWERAFDRIERARFEPIRSQIARPETLAEQILAEVHASTARTPMQLERAFASSLAARQGQTLDVSKMIDEMLLAGMLRWRDPEAGEGILAATPLGRIACRHQLQPATVLLLRRFLEHFNTFTEFDLLVTLAATHDCEPLLPVDYDDLETLADEIGGKRSRIFAKPAEGIRFLGLGGKRLLSALKVGVVLMRWTEVGDAEVVAEEDGCYPFEILRLIDSMDRLLLAASSIRRLIDKPARVDPDPQEPPEEPPKSPAHLRIEILRQMLICGLDRHSASLTLVDGIGSVWAKRLVSIGIKDITKLAKAEPLPLSKLKGLSLQGATKWIQVAPLAAAKLPPTVAAPLVPTIPPEIEIDVDPYRLRRALDLSVQKLPGSQWRVSGGLEPHTVSGSVGDRVCNCADHAKGHVCKHLLAVRISEGDQALKGISDQLLSSPTHAYLDVFQLWFDRT